MRGNNRGLGKLLTAVAAAGLLTISGTSVWAQGPPSFVPGRLLVKFRAGVTPNRARGVLDSAGASDRGEIPRTGVHILRLPAQADEAALQNAFSHHPDVEFAEKDSVLAPSQCTVTPNDPCFTYWSWHLKQIGCPAAWCATKGSSSVIIAILDTGCDPTHPDLAAKCVPGWNFYDNNADTSDVYGHGTAVAGAAAASSNNGTGVASIAWACPIMPIRISDTQGYALSSTIATALTWAADHGARVANISYSVTGLATVDSAAQYFQSRGGVVTVSAGNDGAYHAIADDPYVLTVSATDPNDLLCSWSSSGTYVDVAAPGTVYTTLRGGGYGNFSGTSASAPVVAGVAALALSANPGLTGAQARTLIEQSADLVQGAAGWTPQYGWGRVDAARAVGLAGGGGGMADTTPPTVSITNPAAGATLTGTLTVQASASDNVGVASVAFYVDGTLASTDTASPYTFSWNSSSVANGTHTIAAVAVDAAGNAGSASVSVGVSNTTDTSPPVCSILTPSALIKVGNPLSVTASANDNVGVSRVELWVDGKLASSDASSPYAFSVNTKKWTSGSHTLQCKAYDAAGNRGVSQSVTVYR